MTAFPAVPRRGMGDYKRFTVAQNATPALVVPECHQYLSTRRGAQQEPQTRVPAHPAENMGLANACIPSLKGGMNE
jgi:hypothetical protein